MPENSPITDRDVEQFILECIDSVPHLEALLLIWSSSPKAWTVDDLAQRLYVERDVALNLLHGLVRQNLIANVPGASGEYLYESRSAERDELVSAVNNKYRREIVTVSTMIHRKASSAVRDFANAFRFTKERG
jgi:predicted transcriptional regulator